MIISEMNDKMSIFRHQRQQVKGKNCKLRYPSKFLNDNMLQIDGGDQKQHSSRTFGTSLKTNEFINEKYTQNQTISSIPSGFIF